VCAGKDLEICYYKSFNRNQIILKSDNKSSPSIVKGETLIDTARNLVAMNPDVIVMRHSSSGAACQISKRVKASVINAGDGIHSHPSQALFFLVAGGSRHADSD